MDHNKVRPEKLQWVLLITLVATCWNMRLEAQFGPLASPAHAPQARTQEELDAYLQITTGQQPQTVIHNAEIFAAQYPESELLGMAYQYQMLAYGQANDFQGLLNAGEKALQLQHDNVNALLMLASAISNGLADRPDSGDLLRRAEEYAHRALRGIDQMHVPLEISLEQWESLKGE